MEVGDEEVEEEARHRAQHHLPRVDDHVGRIKQSLDRFCVFRGCEAEMEMNGRLKAKGGRERWWREEGDDKDDDDDKRDKQRNRYR